MRKRTPPPDLVDALIQRGGRREGGEIRFPCVYPDQHNNGDANPSARYHLEKWVWCCDVCKASGGWTNLCDRLGGPRSNRRRGNSTVVATYEYRDEAGKTLRRKLRWVPGFEGRVKSFTWEQPDGRGGWHKSSGNGNPGILYHWYAKMAEWDRNRSRK